MGKACKHEACRHEETIQFSRISRGPMSNVRCGTCGALWNVDSGMAVLLKYVLDRQDAIVRLITDG